MHEDIKWILGIVVIIGIVWYVGASISNSTGTGMELAETAKTRAKDASVPFREDPGVGQVTPEQFSPPKPAPTNAGATKTTAMKATDPNASPLFGRVNINSVARSQSGTAVGEYVILQAPSSNPEPVTITGLTLKSMGTGLSLNIPTASYLPFPGSSGTGEIVRLSPGDVAYIYTGISPNGMSFRLNKCTGYFEQGLNFAPSLPLECPSPLSEPLPERPNQLKDSCIDYLSSYPRCTVLGSKVPASIKQDRDCQLYIEKNLTYDRCVALHKNEPNFYKKNWRIYMSRTSGLYKSRYETVVLLDANGKTIASRSY